MCPDVPSQVNPDRRRLRRGETVEVCSPSTSHDGGPRPRERPLGRCHTLDPGEEVPEQPSDPEQTGATLLGTGETHSADDGSADATSPPSADRGSALSMVTTPETQLPLCPPPPPPPPSQTDGGDRGGASFN